MTQATGDGLTSPTRYGPITCMEGAPVILQACLMPKKIMMALISPDGSDPTTKTTGRVAMKPARMINPRARRPGLDGLRAGVVLLPLAALAAATSPSCALAPVVG